MYISLKLLYAICEKYFFRDSFREKYKNYNFRQFQR
jgi:hypothetical protein